MEVLLKCKHSNRNFHLFFLSISPVCAPHYMSFPLTTKFVLFTSYFPNFYSRANVPLRSTVFPIEFSMVPWHILCHYEWTKFFYKVLPFHLNQDFYLQYSLTFSKDVSQHPLLFPQFQNARKGGIWYTLAFSMPLPEGRG